MAGFEFVTGLVVVCLAGRNGWSTPNAIGMAGVLIGVQVSNHPSSHDRSGQLDDAVNLMMYGKHQVQLRADVGVAVGLIGCTLEDNWGVGRPTTAPIYTYSLSKGLYVGASLDGKVVVTRDDVNEKFYGFQVRPEQNLNGSIPAPPVYAKRCKGVMSTPPIDARRTPVPMTRIQ